MKNTVRLTEGDLHRMIKESVKRVLREMEESGNIEEMAKQVFDSIDFSQGYLEDVDTDSLDWEYTGDRCYEAVSQAEFEKDGWKFSAWVEWNFKSGWWGHDPDWDFADGKIKFKSPDGQEGEFNL